MGRQGASPALRVVVDDVRTLSDRDLIPAVELFLALDAERLPHDPVTPVEARLGYLRDLPPDGFQTLVRVMDGAGGVVAAAQCAFSTRLPADRTMQVSGGVRSPHRGDGLAWLLLSAAVDVARVGNRSLLEFSTANTVPSGQEWANRLAAQLAQVMVTNRLDLRTVDRELLKRWVREGPARAPGYELVAVDDPVSDNLLPVLCELLAVLNDAPRDELERPNVQFTPDQLERAWRRAVEMGIRVRWLLARHRSSGEFVGLHDMQLAPFWATTARIGQTAVKRTHRGHALGKWMKAQMTLWLLDEHPEILDVRTSNATSNDAMLGINTAMGYQVYLRSTTWQLEVESAAAQLARH